MAISPGEQLEDEDDDGLLDEDEIGALIEAVRRGTGDGDLTEEQLSGLGTWAVEMRLASVSLRLALEGEAKIRVSPNGEISVVANDATPDLPGCSWWASRGSGRGWRLQQLPGEMS